MGMQCYFKFSDLPEDATVTSVVDNDHQIEMPDGTIYATWLGDDDYFFDVGSCSEAQMLNLRNLIRNRVSFRCC